MSASGQRTRKDWAREVKSIVREQYPDAEKVVLVMDNANLRFENTHTVSSLYERFPAAEAFGLAQKLEIHYTPKHGSWLNIAEIELSAMTSQCLERRIDTLEKLPGELGVWQGERNQNQKTVKWQFTTEDARIKLH
ncbi:MAG: transposase, partial [Treponema sp.]|nr:transposase [Treponema sp.]